MPREERTYSTDEMSFGEAVEINRREMEQNSPFSLEVTGQNTNGSRTIKASAHLANIDMVGNEIRVVVDAPQRIIDPVMSALNSHSGSMSTQTMDSGPSNSNQMDTNTTTQEPMGGARPTELLPDDAEIQAHMHLYENGMLVIESDGEKEMYNTEAAVFMSESMPGELEVAEAYTTDRFSMRYDSSTVMDALRKAKDMLMR